MHHSQALTELSAEHAQWIVGLDFYRKEIGVLEQRLLAIASGRMVPEVALEVEHFQNQFIVQRNTIDELSHAIQEHVTGFGYAVSQAGGMTAAFYDEGHTHLKDGYQSFEKVMNSLRQEFNRFLAGKV
ncbi:MAG: hypothetical protein EBZ67_12725 [Chitinophagia bacterium]|nr:hypothetical protein [Chitinophagia bacterium]